MSATGRGYQGRGNARGGRGNARGGRGYSNRDNQPTQCYYCGQFGHISRYCPVKISSGDRDQTSTPAPCKNCGKLGHWSRDCPSPRKENVEVPLVVPQASTKYVDTHCHLEYVLQKFKCNNNKDFIKKIHMPTNYEGLISIFCDPTALSPSFGMSSELLNEDGVWGAFGLHPHHAKYYDSGLEKRIISCLEHPKAVAWGECGLDFFKNQSDPEIQKKVFKQQVISAVEIGKPIIVHSRDAANDTYNILKSFVPADWKIHVHCFGDDSNQAVRLLKDFPNLFIGVTGSITFPKSGKLVSCIRDVVPLDRILLETDAPYLTPEPIRGICHSGHVPFIAQRISEIKDVTLETVLIAARKNTTTMYGI